LLSLPFGAALAAEPAALKQEANTWVKRSPLKDGPASPGMGYDPAAASTAGVGAASLRQAATSVIDSPSIPTVPACRNERRSISRRAGDAGVCKSGISTIARSKPFQSRPPLQHKGNVAQYRSQARDGPMLAQTAEMRKSRGSVAGGRGDRSE
jgi:hypothetical protein